MSLFLKRLIVITLLITSGSGFLHSRLHAQDITILPLIYPKWTAGLSYKVYPAGMIFGVRGDRLIGSKNSLSLMVGYNRARHQDFGVHEDERGGGPGISIGYRRYLKNNRTGPYLGLNQDFWMNKIDWRDNIGQTNELSGTTDILVVQPTAEAGWSFVFKDKWVLTPNIAFGMEINTMQEGEDVGEGAILLIGIHGGVRF